jgi:hypothetical protein
MEVVLDLVDLNATPDESVTAFGGEVRLSDSNKRIL